MLHESKYYEILKGNILKCTLCPHHCKVNIGGKGLCSARVNINGEIKTSNYGEISSISLDPIEKKPLYHFFPGSKILSVGTFGCNFVCGFCQNHSISQHMPETKYTPPEELVETIISLKDKKNIGIAFTYNEPSIWVEYIYDVVKLLKQSQGQMKVVLVTNGYFEKEPLYDLMPYIDGMNIDLKSFSNEYYRNLCGGTLDPVLDNIKFCAENTHVEITTLLVSGENDSEEETKKIAGFIGGINENIPLHLSRYFPSYKMEKKATEIEVMLRDKEVAKRFLNYVYLGNVAGVDSSTICPKCGELIVKRDGFQSKVKVLKNRCTKCNHVINLVL